MDRSAKSAGQGRIERLFETLQDRLVKEMRLAGIDSIEAAITSWKRAFSRSGRAFYGGTAQSTQCPSKAGARTSLGRNLSVRVVASGRRSHGQLDGNRWGVPRKRSARLTGSAGGNRTATGRLSLVALPEPLSAPASLPGTAAARGKSFRPTASSFRKSTIKSHKRLLRTIHGGHSIWQKSGHF